MRPYNKTLSRVHSHHQATNYLLYLDYLFSYSITSISIIMTTFIRQGVTRKINEHFGNHRSNFQNNTSTCKPCLYKHNTCWSRLFKYPWRIITYDKSGMSVDRVNAETTIIVPFTLHVYIDTKFNLISIFLGFQIACLFFESYDVLSW